jgi:hypothetical protein
MIFLFDAKKHLLSFFHIDAKKSRIKVREREDDMEGKKCGKMG